MRIRFPLWIVVASGALLHVGGGRAVAQIELSGAATVNSVRGGTFGLGGRLGVPIRESITMGVRLVGGVDYYWPSCAGVDCSLTGVNLNVVFQNRIGGRADTYFGAGGSYQKFTLVENNQPVAEGDAWGANFVAGSQYATQTRARPFLEVRWTLLDDIDNQWALTLGATVNVGR